MTLELFIVLLAAIFVVAALARYYDQRKRRNRPPSAALTPEQEVLVDFNEKFLNVAADRQKVAVARTFTQHDTMLLRSILDAEGLHTYCDTNSLGALYAGIAIDSFSDATIFVFTDEQEAAREIIGAYIEEQKQDIAANPRGSGGPAPRVHPELIV